MLAIGSRATFRLPKSAARHSRGLLLQLAPPRTTIRTQPLDQSNPLPLAARLRGLATAVPAHALPQEGVMAAAGRLFDRPPDELQRLMPAYVNAGIAQRHSCV